MPIRELIHSAAPILEALHDGVAVLDADGLVVYVNQANRRITGLEADELLGRPVQEVVPHSHLEQALTSGQPLIGVRTRVRGREVLSNIVPLYEQGRLIGVVSIFRDLTEVLHLTAALREAENTIALLREHLSGAPSADGLVIGRSPAARRAFTLALRAAGVTSTVLIEGESGTGKEVAARLIHARGDRSKKPFLALNCAAVPGTLLESELFGYEEGAFTGARRGGRAGLFEMADGGTLLLDEIGDMELPMQAKLLRVLQDGEVRRLGGGGVRRVDVRIISATNRPLQELVAARQFREDLYYRLRVIRIVMPALREQREDLPAFIQHGLDRAAARLGRPAPPLGPGALRLLLAYAYPGNVRELENLLEQAVVLDDDGQISEGDLPPELGGAPERRSESRVRAAPASSSGGTEDRLPIPSLAEAERAILAEGLQRFASKQALALHLGISRATLYRKLAQYGLTD